MGILKRTVDRWSSIANVDAAARSRCTPGLSSRPRGLQALCEAYGRPATYDAVEEITAVVQDHCREDGQVMSMSRFLIIGVGEYTRQLFFSSRQWDGPGYYLVDHLSRFVYEGPFAEYETAEQAIGIIERGG